MNKPLYLNINQKFLRSQKREAVITGADDFKEKIQKTYKTVTYVMDIGDLEDKWPKIVDDLKAILFDFENFEADPDQETDSLMGFQTLENGLNFWGMYAHGDWEEPVFFILYWDGSSMRAYIPLLGNTWNPHTGAALGNGMEKLFERINDEQAFEALTQQPNFKDPDTQFLEQSYGGPLPNEFEIDRDVKFYWPSIKFDLENTLLLKTVS